MANSLDRQPPSSAVHPRCIFLAGPTAVGKSAVAMTLAERIGGEIISVDSMQVYRGLDIGTAKPTAEERRRVPHHLLDVCDLHEIFDAARFVQLAEQAVTEIESHGRTPIFCGGTGLYFKAFLDGLGEAPAADLELRATLEATPHESLLRELREQDPVTYEKIDKQNPRRVIRAVEVIRLTGKPFSAQRAKWSETSGEPLQANIPSGSRKREPHRQAASIIKHQASAMFCFTRSSTDLHTRINARVDEMFASGLVKETRELLEHGLAENKFAMQAIGYRQVVEHLRGERELAETIERVKIRTRNFAKRQLTWFRRHGNCQWIELNPDEPVEASLAAVLALCSPESR